MKAVRWLVWLLFRFSGTASRGVYILGLTGSAALVLAILLVFEPQALEQSEADLTPTTLAAALVGWWCWIALLVKRLRDIGLGWGWALLALVPAFLPFVLLGFAIPKSRDGQDAPSEA